MGLRGSGVDQRHSLLPDPGRQAVVRPFDEPDSSAIPGVPLARSPRTAVAARTGRGFHLSIRWNADAGRPLGAWRCVIEPSAAGRCRGEPHRPLEGPKGRDQRGSGRRGCADSVATRPVGQRVPAGSGGRERRRFLRSPGGLRLRSTGCPGAVMPVGMITCRAGPDVQPWLTRGHGRCC